MGEKRELQRRRWERETRRQEIMMTMMMMSVAAQQGQGPQERKRTGARSTSAHSAVRTQTYRSQQVLRAACSSVTSSCVAHRSRRLVCDEARCALRRSVASVGRVAFKAVPDGSRDNGHRGRGTGTNGTTTTQGGRIRETPTLVAVSRLRRACASSNHQYLLWLSGWSKSNFG